MKRDEPPATGLPTGGWQEEAGQCEALPRWILLAAVGAAAALLAYGQLTPRATLKFGFSGDRAMENVQALAAQPRPMGSAGHTAAREYLTDRLQSAGVRATNEEQVVRDQSSLGRVRNVVARVDGRSPGGAILLVAHYDTVPHSPGAADDAVGVAVVMEALRTLAGGPQPARSVIGLFTDGEEAGLLGALAASASLSRGQASIWGVINFEARGSGGPALIFETSEPNEQAVRWLKRTRGPVRASSLYHAAYKRLPYGTDFQRLSPLGRAGLNFAFIARPQTYHSRADVAQGIDAAMLQDLGDAVLSLVASAASDDAADGSQSYVYFDVLAGHLVAYPSGWAVPLAVSVAFSWLVVAALGRPAGGLGLKSQAAGLMAPWLVALLMGGGAQLQQRWSQPRLELGLAWIAWVSAAAGFTWVLYRLGGRRASTRHGMVLGTALTFVLLSVLLAVYEPAASYPFQWSAVTLLVSALVLRFGGPRPWPTCVLLAVTAAVTLALWVPPLIWLWIGLGAMGTPVILPLLALGLSALAPQLAWLGEAAAVARAALGLAALAAAGAVGLTLWGPAPASWPQPWVYAVRAGGGGATWATPLGITQADTAPAAVTAGEALFPSYGFDWSKTSATGASLPGPTAEVVGDRIESGARSMRLRLKSSRAAPVLFLWIRDPEGISEAALAGQPFDAQEADRQARRGWWLRFTDLPPEGVELSLNVVPGRPVRLALCDQTFTLPDGLAPPGGVTESAGWLAHSTFVTADHVF